MIPERSDPHRGIIVFSSVNCPSLYDPLAVRLVKCYGIVIVSLNDGTEQLIPFEDRLYFENIPANNTGAVGLVYDEFMPLASGRTAQLTPYQEVASGYDNEKFNGDYGNSVGGFTSTAPDVTFDKTGTAVVTGGDVATYTLTAGNTGTAGLGIPQLSLPFVFEDSIPAGLVDLGAGTWFVKVRTGTLPLAGGLPIPLTSDPDRDGVPVGDNTYPGLPAGDDGDSLVIISLGGNHTGADFGYQPSGALGDFVWLDLDQDVVQDAGEQGVSGPVEDQRLTARVATNGDKQLAAAVPVGKMAQNADGQ